MRRLRIATLTGLLLGLLVNARSWQRAAARTAPRSDHALAVRHELERAEQRRARAAVHAETRARRRTAMTVALVAVAALPGVAIAASPDLGPEVVGTVVGLYAVIAVAALLVAVRADDRT